MIYIEPPDSFSYLEKYDEMELFYKEYNEVKGDLNKVKSMLSKVANPRAYLLPEVYGDVDVLKTRTLFDDYYKHDITIRKHTRHSPDIEHDHRFFEMIYILKGKADNTIEGYLYKMTEGDICIIPPNIYHKLWVNDDSIVINVIIRKRLFDNEFFGGLKPENSLIMFIKQNAFMQPLGDRKFCMFHSLHNAYLRNLFALLISESLKGQDCFYTKKALLLAIFNYLDETNDDNNQIMENNELSNSILEYIQKNYSTITLTELAEHFNYSEPYLSKLIFNITGVSYANILQTTRLKEACHLLATTNIKICDIPSVVGYDSNVYFNRLFKQKIGTTPYKYRKMHKETSLI